ncbi:SURP and G-patch domain-containing protein 1-like protein [Morella rubra]|uniref:SURP and G-patch domain-containing protein 1-like protein n=1 Tax=Morella rubra TaxID=262757 RepID=A0A6A1WLI5_9ROSI|nr:SURP and G-patch domain-containing protein 1-like protein [Morella rubra]
MDKGTPPSLFVNDGSFMERFKQLQQEKASEKDTRAKLEVSKPITIKSGSLTANPTINKTSVEFKTNDTRKNPQGASGGKLAFSLKQKSKIVAPPVKLGADEDEDEIDAGKVSADAPMKRQKLDQGDASEFSSRQVDGVKKVADKLASFVAKNGRQFEDITRQKNPGDTPFKFLFDKTCPDYKYYEYQLAEEEKAFSQTREPQTSHSGVKSSSASKSTSGSQRSFQQHYQTPASALYDATEDQRVQTSAGGSGEASAPTGADPIAMMEFYMKKAAQEERFRQPKQSKDEMPPPASLQGPAAPSKKGHHMGDYIPQEELEKFLAACNDAASQKATREAAERAKIQADNVGHKLLSKMGWKEGEGLGSSKNGIADPIMAGDVKMNNLGVGAHNPGEVTAEDDIYEQYKKRMMLGYRYRPNPLPNSFKGWQRTPEREQ